MYPNGSGDFRIARPHVGFSNQRGDATLPAMAKLKGNAPANVAKSSDENVFCSFHLSAQYKQ